MSEKIDLVLSKNNVFVWTSEDWLILRRDHRIVGELIGCLAKHPRQDVLSGLPLLLLNEEVTLLIEKGIARVVKYPCLQEPPSTDFKNTFEAYRDKLFLEQEQCLREERQKQVLLMMDKIVEGKKRKLLGIDTKKKKVKKPVDPKMQQALDKIVVNRDELLKEEMTKLPKLEKSEALVQTHTVYPWLNKEDVVIVDWKYPSTPEEEHKYKTYKDLWEKEFYVTTGEKFGGDFLVYPGEPIMFHSQFIVQCKDRCEEMSVMELIAQCRISCHVRKTQVYAMLDEDNQNIQYQSFQWAESSMLETV